MNQNQWYVVYTKYRSEKKVASSISELDVECYLPTYKTVRKKRGSRKIVELPLFPSYLFVKISEKARPSLFSIKNLVKFVSVEKRPVVVPDKDIMKIKQALSAEDTLIQDEQYFKKGTKVRITNGQFSGLEGIIIEKSNSIRFLMKIEGLQRAFSLNISAKMAEEVEFCT